MTRRLILLALVGATGCYAYLPINSAPKPGERVRIALSPQGSVELARYLGPRVIGAEGALNGVTEGAYVVAVDYVQFSDNTRQPWSGEGVVTIPLQYATGVQQRTYQKRQTIVAASAITGGLIAAAIIALRSGGAGGGGTTPPPPPP